MRPSLKEAIRLGKKIEEMDDDDLTELRATMDESTRIWHSGAFVRSPEFVAKAVVFVRAIRDRIDAELRFRGIEPKGT